MLIWYLTKGIDGIQQGIYFSTTIQMSPKCNVRQSNLR